MKKSLTLIGIIVAFTSLLFGVERHYSTAALFGPVDAEKIRTLTCPSSSEVVLPQTFQSPGEQSQSDQSKKIKTLLGSSLHFFIYKSRFPTIQNKWIKSHLLHHQLFILFKNLRL